MSKWQRTLDLKDIWNKADKKEITTEKLASDILERLSNIKPVGIEYIDEKLITLICEFEYLAAHSMKSGPPFFAWANVAIHLLCAGVVSGR